MSLKDSIDRADKATNEEGGSFYDRLLSIELGKMVYGLFALLLLGATVAAVILLAPTVIESVMHDIAIKNCKCENIDLDYTASYDYENKLLITRCDFCHKPKTLQATVKEVAIDVKPGCIYDGYRLEIWTYNEFPDFEEYISYNVPPTNHKIGDVFKEGYEPTCTQEGLTDEGYCAYCLEYIEGQPIPKLAHNLELTKYIAPTCTTVGYEVGKICSECDYVSTKPKEIPMLKHNFVNGNYEATYEMGAFKGEKCADCGAVGEISAYTSEPLVVEYLDYKIVNDKCVITNVKIRQENFVIPEYINNYLVVELAEGLFKDDQVLKTISLPANLSVIKNDTFNGCINLKSVVIPDSVKTIESRAFYNCTSLKVVDLGKGVEKVLEQAFDNCNEILSFKFSPNIDYSNFYSDNVFPKFLVKGSNYGNGYFSIPVLYIPESMRTLAIPKHEHLYFLPDDNDYVYEENGYYFFNDNGHKELLGFDKELIKNDTLIVPDKTEVLGDNFFYKNELFTNIVLPRTLYRVHDSYRKLYNAPSEQFVNVFYSGTSDERNFMHFGNAELAAGYTDDYMYYVYSNEYWYLNEDGVIVKK